VPVGFAGLPVPGDEWRSPPITMNAMIEERWIHHAPPKLTQDALRAALLKSPVHLLCLCRYSGNLG
jgi:hypothetical protein